MNTAVRVTFKDGNIVEYPSLEEASKGTGLSESAIKIRCNKSRQGSMNKKDKITCMWVDEHTFRSYNAKKSKRKGSGLELDIIKDLTSLGYKGLVSSRSQNKLLDAAKVDIAETDDKLPFYIQCKATAQTPNIENIIKECPLDDRPLIVVWRKQNATIKQHDYVIMPKEVLYNLIKK